MHGLPVAFTHDEVEASEDRNDITHHMPRSNFGEDREIDERGGADLESVRNTAADAIDVESEFSFGIFCAEIDLSFGGIDPLGDDHELMNELFHLGEHFVFGRKITFAIAVEEWSLGYLCEDLLEYPATLAHLFDAN